MEPRDFLRLLKSKKQIVTVIVLAALVISLGFSFSQSLKYGTSSRLLVIQNISGADAYTVSKSNEFVSSLFAEVTSSSSFFKLVLDSEYDINKEYFAGNLQKQIKTWQKTVEAKNIKDSGLISVSVYHPNPEQAKQIALAVNHVLMTKNINYQGVGESLTIAVVDQPIVSNYPVKPNIIVNLILALVFGLVIGLAYVYLLGLSKLGVEPEYIVNHTAQDNYLVELEKEKQRTQETVQAGIAPSQLDSNLAEVKESEATELREGREIDIEDRGSINNVFNG